MYPSIYYNSQFAGLNNKRFSFYDGIISIPFGHPQLERLRKEKKKETNIQLRIKEKREEYLNAEAKAVRQCERLRVLRSFLLQAPVLYKLDSDLICKSITKLPTKNYVLTSHYDSVDIINICYRNNIKLYSETIFTTDIFEEIFS